MSHTAKLKRGWSLDGESLEKEESVSFGQLVTVDEPVEDSQTDYLIALTLDVSQLKAIYLESDQDVTLETNDGTTPDDTISLSADKPKIWTEEDGASLRPFTADVTALYVTNSSGSTANLKFRFGVDPTV